MSLVG